MANTDNNSIYNSLSEVQRDKYKSLSPYDRTIIDQYYRTLSPDAFDKKLNRMATITAPVVSTLADFGAARTHNWNKLLYGVSDEEQSHLTKDYGRGTLDPVDPLNLKNKNKNKGMPPGTNIILNLPQPNTKEYEILHHNAQAYAINQIVNDPKRWTRGSLSYTRGPWDPLNKLIPDRILKLENPKTKEPARTSEDPFPSLFGAVVSSLANDIVQATGKRLYGKIIQDTLNKDTTIFKSIINILKKYKNKPLAKIRIYNMEKLGAFFKAQIEAKEQEYKNPKQ